MDICQDDEGHGQSKRFIGTLVLATLLCLALTGCVGEIWTGASLAYDRHNIYKKLSDFQLSTEANQSLFYNDRTFKCPQCQLDLTAFNGDLLIAGHVPTKELRQEVAARMKKIPDIRRFFNELSVSQSGSSQALDSWITMQIRSAIFADSRINPSQFKVVTSDQVVYLMGDVIPNQAELVIQIARQTENVSRVVKLFKYYNLSDKPQK